MVSEIVASVCVVAPASDRFDCLLNTICSWLATLSLVHMPLMTLHILSSSYDKMLVVGVNANYDSDVVADTASHCMHLRRTTTRMWSGSGGVP
jgi:uncharacterized protein involved in cysteine biosynthesis